MAFTTKGCSSFGGVPGACRGLTDTERCRRFDSETKIEVRLESFENAKSREIFIVFLKCQIYYR